jgi:hypothetical protein
MADHKTPDTADSDPAEGSRDTVQSNLDEDAGGITNRPLDEEEENQRELPPRGTARDPQKDHA